MGPISSGDLAFHAATTLPEHSDVHRSIGLLRHQCDPNRMASIGTSRRPARRGRVRPASPWRPTARCPAPERRGHPQVNSPGDELVGHGMPRPRPGRSRPGRRAARGYALSSVTRARMLPCDQPLVRSTPNSANRSVVLISIVLTMPTIADEQGQADGHQQERVDLPHQGAEVGLGLAHAPGVEARVGLLDRRGQLVILVGIVALDIDAGDRARRAGCSTPRAVSMSMMITTSSSIEPVS